MNIGKVIRQLRTERNLSQLGLGLLIGNDSAYISRIEGGRKEPSLRTLVRIAHALDVDPVVMLEKIIREDS